MWADWKEKHLSAAGTVCVKRELGTVELGLVFQFQSTERSFEFDCVKVDLLMNTYKEELFLSGS